MLLLLKNGCDEIGKRGKFRPYLLRVRVPSAVSSIN
jgi:hypothetical protein